MGPSRVATILRAIASKIDASVKPDRGLVAASLRRVVAGIELDISEGDIQKSLSAALAQIREGEEIPLQGPLFSNLMDLYKYKCTALLDEGMIYIIGYFNDVRDTIYEGSPLSLKPDDVAGKIMDDIEAMKEESADQKSL